MVPIYSVPISRSRTVQSLGSKGKNRNFLACLRNAAGWVSDFISVCLETRCRFGNLKQASSRPPGGFLTPKRPPKRCENATVRSQVSNLIPPPPREAPGRLNPPFRESQTGIFKASRGLFGRQNVLRNVAKTQRFVPKCQI